MRAAFVINARQKENFVRRACLGAIAQTYPCEIIFSDQGSTDSTLAIMQEVAATQVTNAHHQVRVLQCPIEGPFCMQMANAHMDWLFEQVAPDTEYIFQCSADDYSLPDRVAVCMNAIDQFEIKPSCVACVMYFEEPGTTNRESVSGYPKSSGFVKAGDGITNLAYGSTIHGWRRDFALKIKGMAAEHTPDVLMGWLASLDEGFYVVANPQHVHVTHADVNNLGFQGRMRGASGELAHQLAELNHYQLAALYWACMDASQKLWPQGIDDKDWHPLLNMILGQSHAWLDARKKLHQLHIEPKGME